MIQLNMKQKVIVAVVYTAVCIAGGRYLTPVQVKIETKTITVEAKTEDKTTNEEKNTHEKKVIVEADKPDGSKTITTTVEVVNNDTTVGTDKAVDDIKSDKEMTKTVTKESSKLHLSFLTGINVINPSQGLIYGGEVSKDILGPLSIGIFGLSSGTAGCSIGLSF